MHTLVEIKKYFYPRTILDIGANVGQFHVYARHFYPHSYIFSIEASVACEPALQLITDQYHIGLVAAENKEYQFYTRKDAPGATGDSIYKELTPYYSDENTEVQILQGITLDSMFPRGFIFDLIKMDTQGSELDIIRGGQNVCSHARGILMEVAVDTYNAGAPTKQEVLDYMQDFKFAPIGIFGMEYHPIHKTAIQENILFLNTGI